MNKDLKKVISWTLFIIILTIIIISLIASIINMIQPTFFPEVDISGFKNYTNAISVLLSFLSAGLGMFSIWQSNLSSQQSVEILNGIKDIEKEQKYISNNIMSVNQHNIERTDANEKNKWRQDTVYK